MSPARVLITGGGGFIGGHLVDHQLAMGREVTVLDTHIPERLKSGKRAPRLRLVEGDIRNTELLNRTVPGTHLVYHLASAHLEVSRDESHYREVNVQGARKLASVAAREGVRRFVHCSSVGVYGPLTRVPADEDSPCRPEIAYEATKLEGEKAVLAVANDQGLPTVVLRPSWVYGPGCPRTRKLFQAIEARRFFLVGKGQNLRHPLFIDDLLQAFELAATREGVEGQVFVIASSTPVTLMELIYAVQQVTNVHFRPRSVSPRLMWPVCRAAELYARVSGKEPPISTRSLKFFLENSGFSIDKARRLLGYDPRVELAAGLMATWQALHSTPAMTPSPGNRA